MHTRVPSRGGHLVLTDGGLETTLIDHGGFDLPDFAAFPLLDSAAGRAALERYFTAYIAIAQRYGLDLVLETPTWRASADWGDRLGYDADALRAVNIAAVKQLRALRSAHDHGPHIIVSGNLGPRCDGYSSWSAMTADEAQQYHRPQMSALHDAGADLVTALTIAHVNEAIGIVRAGAELGIRVVISFTVEVDGHLPSGQRLDEAITTLDEATAAGAEYVMVNCAHPSHVMAVIDPDAAAFARIVGIRANASALSHTELDESDELDDGDPDALALHYRELLTLLPNLTVMGGCCGTDDRHVEAIAAECAPLLPR